LLAVAQRRVENDQMVGHVVFLACQNIESARARLAGTVLQRKGYQLSARGAQQQQTAQDERGHGRGGGPEARGGRGKAAHR